ELKSIYSKQAEHELLQTVREFHTSKQAEGQSVSSHVLKMKGYIDNSERLAAKEGHGKGKGKTGYASNNATSTPKPKTPPPPKKDNSAKDAICHQCGEVRHWRRNCPVYLAELIKKKKLSQGASTSEIQRNLAHLGAYDMLQELKAMYSKQAEQELLQNEGFRQTRKINRTKLLRGIMVKVKARWAASNNAPFSPKPKTLPPPKKDNPAKDAICHQCGEVG
nr:zinc finger, CCHC-type [Tanacetum cinerariifolium]